MGCRTRAVSVVYTHPLTIGCATSRVAPARVAALEEELEALRLRVQPLLTARDDAAVAMLRRGGLTPS